MRRAIIALAAFAATATSALAQSAPYPTDADVGHTLPLCSDNGDPNFTGFCMGPAGRLDITLRAFQLRRAADGAMVTIASGAHTFDFASVAANTDVGQYASTLKIAYGTYDGLGFTIGIDTAFSGQTDGGAAGACAITPCLVGFPPRLARQVLARSISARSAWSTTMMRWSLRQEIVCRGSTTKQVGCRLRSRLATRSPST